MTERSADGTEVGRAGTAKQMSLRAHTDFSVHVFVCCRYVAIMIGFGAGCRQWELLPLTEVARRSHVTWGDEPRHVQLAFVKWLSQNLRIIWTQHSTADFAPLSYSIQMCVRVYGELPP